MKKHFLVLVLVGLGMGSSALAANVCTLMVRSQGPYAMAVQRSCDGEDVQNLALSQIGARPILAEVSAQLSALYSDGLRLINCQINNLPGGQMEYVCIVAR